MSLSTLVPATPGGIGTEQALLVYAFRDIGVARSTLLAFSVGMKIVLTVVNVVVGFAAIFLTLGTVRFRRSSRHRRRGTPTGGLISVVGLEHLASPVVAHGVEQALGPRRDSQVAVGEDDPLRVAQRPRDHASRRSARRRRRRPTRRRARGRSPPGSRQGTTSQGCTAGTETTKAPDSMAMWRIVASQPSESSAVGATQICGPRGRQPSARAASDSPSRSTRRSARRSWRRHRGRRPRRARGRAARDGSASASDACAGGRSGRAASIVL